ncbi:MAG: response regulator receiver protein [Gracilibacter sp. BRH_c7a]|nr:MAG: response regulator receiver protein [Gracilibacter sp. BRH_c7a]
MKRAILIAKEKILNDLSPVLPVANYQAIAKTDNGIEALRMAQRVDPDLIICGWDIDGLNPLDLLQNLVHSHICPVILILEEKEYPNLHLAVKTNLHQIVAAPLRAADVVTAIVQAEHKFEIERKNMDEIRRLNDEIKTRKIIFQAVLILVADGLDEETAYNSLRSQAMTSRKTIKAVATEVIKGLWKP